MIFLFIRRAASKKYGKNSTKKLFLKSSIRMNYTYGDVLLLLLLRSAIRLPIQQNSINHFCGSLLLNLKRVDSDSFFRDLHSEADNLSWFQILLCFKYLRSCKKLNCMWTWCNGMISSERSWINSHISINIFFIITNSIQSVFDSRWAAF